MFISKSAFNRVAVGTALKSIGSVARIGDFPNEQKSLRNKAMQRETTVIGIIFGSSVLLEGAMESAVKLLKYTQPRGAMLKLVKNPFVSFVPLAFAYGFAEWYSRKVTSFSQLMQDSLAKGKPVAAPVSAERDAEHDDDDDDDAAPRPSSAPLHATSLHPAQDVQSVYFQAKYSQPMESPFIKARYVVPERFY